MGLSVTHLSNFAMYLLDKSTQGDAAHEKNHLARIMNLLMSVESHKHKYSARFAKLRTSLLKALERRLQAAAGQQVEKASHPTKEKKEFLTVDVVNLERWLKCLE